MEINIRTAVCSSNLIQTWRTKDAFKFVSSYEYHGSVASPRELVLVGLIGRNAWKKKRSADPVSDYDNSTTCSRYRAAF